MIEKIGDDDKISPISRSTKICIVSCFSNLNFNSFNPSMYMEMQLKNILFEYELHKKILCKKRATQVQLLYMF